MKKYIPIFGPQELFDGAPEDAVLAIKDTTSGRIHFFTNDGWIKSGLKHERHIGTSDNQIAMRRIIKVPVWKKADQLAGKLPEVGAELLHESEGYVNFVGEFDFRWMLRTKEEGLYLAEKFYCSPIETPEEKSARLREEWCSKALDSAGILSEMKRYELKRLGEYIGSIHDALQSGELPMPNKESE